MTHTRHAPDLRQGMLDENCGRCQEHTLGSLDDAHLAVACGIDATELRAFLNAHPQLYSPVMHVNAMDVQRDLQERLPLQPRPVAQERQ